MSNHQTPREYMLENGMTLILQTYEACKHESRIEPPGTRGELLPTTLFYLFAELVQHTIIEKHVYDFWFYKLLSDPSEKFISILLKNNYVLFQKDERSVSLFVERYVKVLCENNHQEKAEKIITLALNNNALLNVSVIKSLKGIKAEQVSIFEKLSNQNSLKLLEKNTKNLTKN